jgi:Flp pilus assembly pilin Flp
MSLKQKRGRERGQSLVEYALILALVALVVIVGASLLGQAVQRVYGVITGALGAKYNTIGARSIVIESAQCFAVQSTHQTGLYVLGTIAGENVADLTGSTDQAVGTGLGGLSSPVEANGDFGFKFHPLLSPSTADLSLCPRVVVIQSKDGAMAVSPITAEVVP